MFLILPPIQENTLFKFSTPACKIATVLYGLPSEQLLMPISKQGKKRTASKLGDGAAQDEEHMYHPVNLQESPDKSQ